MRTVDFAGGFFVIGLDIVDVVKRWCGQIYSVSQCSNKQLWDSETDSVTQTVGQSYSHTVIQSYSAST